MADRNRNSSAKKRKKPVSTRVQDDAFSDALDMRKLPLSSEAEKVLEAVWEAAPDLFDVLESAANLETARDGVYTYLDRIDRHVFALDNPHHALENALVRDAVRVLRSVIGPINEKRTGQSALDSLWKLATDRRKELKTEVSVAFLKEIQHLLKAIHANSAIYREDQTVGRSVPEFLLLEGRKAATKRTEQLDRLAARLRSYFERYPSGLDEAVVQKRAENRTRILEYFHASPEDWNDYQWHLKHVIKKASPLLDLVEISRERRRAVRKAVEARLPFGITPYYLSLMDPERADRRDHAVQAMVVPPPEYVDAMVDNRAERDSVFDFMGENDTSPEDLITRRYPLICILKPFNTCAQICVYCQRNWEIDECMAPNAAASRKNIDKALAWIGDHPGLGDILITGGDPMVMSDKKIQRLLEPLSKMDHVYRIRIGSRTPVVLPARWTDSLVEMLGRYHQPGRREIAVVTHFEHSYEITPEAMGAIQAIRNQGMSVYNQQVFTIENSRRFETVKLRRDLRTIGVDPYYTFNMKGKEETRRLMVPIARILQERKEEARMLPGLDRTDEPVFNVPRLGKNHLRAFQDHRLVMIRPDDGARVYEFHPWEKNIVPTPPYNYTDVPIHDYLEELEARGEDPKDYKTIWYYY